MSRCAKIAFVGLTALNVLALLIHISVPTRAAIGGKSYEDLVEDPDFTLAVQAVVEKCKVKIDIARVGCMPEK
jgi:hypothetical protein